MLNIKEIALKIADSLRNKSDGISHMQSNQGLARFAEALINSYKAELLKEVGEPFGYMIQHYADYPDVFFKHPLTKGYSALMARTKLYTSDQVAAVVLKATKPLEDQLAKAEQRVAEACALTYLEDYDLTDIADRVRAGEWRKFVKEV